MAAASIQQMVSNTGSYDIDKNYKSSNIDPELLSETEITSIPVPGAHVYDAVLLKQEQSKASSLMTLPAFSRAPGPILLPVKLQAKPKSLLEKLQAAKSQHKHNLPSQSTISAGLPKTKTISPCILNTLHTEIRIMIYDEYFKHMSHESETPALVVALRPNESLYAEMMERYYRTCEFVLSASNLLAVQENTSMRVMHAIEHLTLCSSATSPTVSSLSHINSSKWMNGRRYQTDRDFPNFWCDYQGIVEKIFSFASMEKVQQTMKLRFLTIHTDVAFPQHLLELIERSHDHYPLLEALTIRDKRHKTGRDRMSYLAEKFAGDRNMKFTLIRRFSRGSMFQIPLVQVVGFDCKGEDTKESKGGKKHFRVILN